MKEIVVINRRDKTEVRMPFHIFEQLEFINAEINDRMKEGYTSYIWGGSMHYPVERYLVDRGYDLTIYYEDDKESAVRIKWTRGRIAEVLECMRAYDE